MRILLLCNNYHPLSIACLEALYAAGRFEICVGLHRPLRSGICHSARGAWRRYGLGETAKRGVRFAAAITRLAARRCGLPLAGYRSVRELLYRHDLDHFDLSDVNAPATRNALTAGRFDLFVAAAFSQILSSETLAIPPRGAINVHLSLLPKYRGPSPCHWVIQNGEHSTGITVHLMETRIDAGAILLQRGTSVHPRETPTQLERRLALLGAELLLETLAQLESGAANPTPQSESEATYHSFPHERRSNSS